MPDDLDQLIGALQALPVDLDAENVADMLWLLAPIGADPARSPSVPEVPDQLGTSPVGPAAEPPGPGEETPPPPPAAPGDLYDGRLAGSGERRARRVRIHRPRALPVPLDIARSLRAFNRRWRNGRTQQLDLDASVAGYARTGHLTPVFRPAPERWFEATVLVDDSPSMELWRDTVAEFTAVLRQLGAFRSVRLLTLGLDGEHPRVLNAAGRVTHPRQLRSSTGRRLVLVLSDCLADAWSGSAVWRMLWEWGRSTPTALVNPLPSSLWRRTGLDLPAARVSSASVGGANTTLRYQEPWELVVLSGEQWLPVPTPALTAQSMHRWANTLMRADPTGTDAVLIPATGRIEAPAGAPAGASSLQSFRHVATEEAFRLAVLSSPHDPVSLQMLGLLRDQFVPEATAGDMAEIIASGVATAERDAGHTVLRVRPDLRQQLQQVLSAPDAWRIHEVLTDYVATHAGTPGDLVLAVPDPAGTATLPAELQPFADASRSTLRLLGIVPRTRIGRDHELVRLLSGARIDDVRSAYRLVAAGAPGDDLTDIVQALDLVRVGAEDLPKAIEFAEYLAAGVDPPLAGELRSWAAAQARERGVVDTLLRLRADVEADSRPASGTGSARSGSHVTSWQLVRALQDLPCLASPQDRNFVVRLLADRLGHLPIEESPRIQQHLFNIVDVCDRRTGGLAALLDVVSELDEGTIYFRRFAALVADRAAEYRWPEEERERLFGLLSGMIFRDLVELYYQVAGANAPELPAETTYREVFLTLETLRADATGLPKPIVFVEHLAYGRRPELSTELRRWSDRQASRLNVITELQALRRAFSAPPPGPAPNEPAYLVLLIRRNTLDSNWFQLDHWSQIDLSEGWHPKRGPDFTGTLDEVKRQVAVLIEEVETKWAKYQPDIRIEFILPGELLNLDVEQWPWEVETALPPVPIGCRYLCVIRSLERMQSGAWHRSWHARWRVLSGQLQQYGAIDEASGWLAESGAPIRRLVVDLENNPSLVSLTLSAPPDGSDVGGGEVAVGLRAGVPIMVWHREDCDSEEFLAAAREVLHGDGSGVLQRVKQLRTTAYQSHAGHVGHCLVLMWDEPFRLVVPPDLDARFGGSESSIA